MQITLNLATRRYYHRPRFRLILLLLSAALALLIGTGASRLIGLRAEAQRLTQEISDLDKRLAGHPSGVTEEQFSLHRQQLATLNGLLAQRQQSRLALLDALEATLPIGVAYTHIVPEQKDKQVKLEGRVRSLATLSDLLERLGTASGFSKPTLLTTEQMTSQTAPGAPGGLRFVITVGWDGP